MTWIPVGERLPDRDDVYLVTVISHLTSKPHVRRAVFFLPDRFYSAKALVDILAWMPLPEPYQPPG